MQRLLGILVNKHVTVCFVALIFSLFHYQTGDGVQLVLARHSSFFLSGLLYGYASINEKNLLLPISMHSMENGISYFLARVMIQ